MSSRLSRGKERDQKGKALRERFRVHSGRKKDLEIYSAADVEPEPLPVEATEAERPRRAIVSINGKDVGEEIIVTRRSA